MEDYFAQLLSADDFQTPHSVGVNGYIRYDTVESLRLNTPPCYAVHLDLSYCKGLVDDELQKLRTKPLSLECLDLSGLQDHISIKELAKTLAAFPTLTKLKLHDWKLDSNILKVIFSHKKITYLGISAMVPQIDTADQSISSSSSGLSLNLFFLCGKELELTNFEDYINVATSQGSFRSFLPLIHLTGSTLPQSLVISSFLSDLVTPPGNSSPHLSNSRQSNNSSTGNNNRNMQFYCPQLAKLHLIFRKEMKISDLHMFITRMVEASCGHLEEVTLYLPPHVYNTKRVHDLTMSLPDMFPRIVFFYARYEHEQFARRSIIKGGAERREEYNTKLKIITEIKPHSMSEDFIKAFEARNENVELCDIQFEVAGGQIIRAHRIMLEARCPQLMYNKDWGSQDANVLILLLKYIYTDHLLLNVPLLPIQNDLTIFTLDKQQEVTLRELSQLAKEYELLRLQEICTFLLRGPLLSDETEQIVIPPKTLESDISRALYSSSFAKFNDVTLLAPSTDSSEGYNQLTASKFILASRCEYFRRLFNSGMRDSSSRKMTFDDIPFGTLSTLIEFLYSDHTRFDYLTAVDSFAFADRMGLQPMQDQCLKNIQNNLNPSNVIYMSMKAYKCPVDSTILRDTCFNYFTQHALAIFNNWTEIVRLKWDMLRVFLATIYNFLIEDTNQDEYNTISLQCSILTTVLRWARSKCLRHQEGSTTINIPLFRKILQNILKYLHTNRVSPVDFAHCLIESDVFPKEMIISTFEGMGVILVEENEHKTKRANNSSTAISCQTCNNWGYIRLPIACSKCSGLSMKIGFCSWCSSTGQSVKVGPPCGDCLRGEIVHLKAMFDSKVLNECIRIHLPEMEQQEGLNRDLIIMDCDDILNL